MGDQDRIRKLVLRQREQPGDLFFTAPKDIEALEAVVGKPIDLDQLDLEICSRARDQGLVATDDVAGLAALGGTVGKCIASLKKVGPNAAGIAVLQSVSRGTADPTYTSAVTLRRLEQAVGDLPISPRALETCADAFHINVVVGHSLLKDNPPPCTSGETGCPTGPPGSGGSCCSAGETCMLPTCRNCEAYCERRLFPCGCHCSARGRLDQGYA